MRTDVTEPIWGKVVTHVVTGLLVVFSLAAQGQAILPGRAIDEALFQLREMDMHIHAGMERQVGLEEWIDLSVADGRKVMVLLDHLELYRSTPVEHAASVQKWGKDWYPLGAEGHEALMDDLTSTQARKDVLTFRGWEIWEGELDEGVEPEPMRMAEVIGWHMSPNSDPPPCGRTLIARIKQIIQIQKEFPIPMIVFHPFSMGFERIQRDAQRTGRDLSTLTVDDYRFFQPGEQEQVAELLEGASVYIEISRGNRKYWDNPVAREALIADVKPLADRGVQFTVSTDAHGVRSLTEEFNPERYCESLGVTPTNTNTIVRELLALRARRRLETAE